MFVTIRRGRRLNGAEACRKMKGAEGVLRPLLAFSNLLVAELRHGGMFVAFSEPAGYPQAFYHANPPDSLEGPLSRISFCHH